MKEKKSVSLNRVILVSTVLGCCAIMILLTCMDCFLIGNYQKTKLQEQKAVIEKLAQAYGEDLSELQKYLYDIYINDLRFQALGSGVNPEDSYDYEYELNQDINSKMLLNEWLHGYLLYDYQNAAKRYCFDDTKIPEEDLEQIRQIQQEIIDYASNNWEWMFTQVNGSVYGFLYCKKNYALLEMVYSFEEGEKNLELNERQQGNIFYSLDGKLLDNHIEDEKERSVKEDLAEETLKFENSFSRNKNFSRYLLTKVPGTDLWLGVQIQLDLFSYMNITQLLLVAVTCTILVAFFVLYQYMKKKFFYPLEKLQNTMDEISQGNWDCHMEDTGNLEEIQKVNAAMEAMVAEIRKQKIAAYEGTIQKQKAQMQYLKLQLKPHFYLNSLKTLNVLAKRGDKEKAQDLIMELSYHLRYLLQAEKELVLLKNEIKYVKNYEQMQGILTGRKFAIKWNVDGEAQHWMIPTLGIQTFIENSLKYAKVGENGNTLLIKIYGQILDTENGKFLDIRICDNGNGYPNHVLQEINGETETEKSSVGILNLKRRCHILYGDKAEYYFYNEDGAVSELILPFRKEMDNEAVDCG